MLAEVLGPVLAEVLGYRPTPEQEAAGATMI